jgi:hypothetical protein
MMQRHGINVTHSSLETEEGCPLAGLIQVRLGFAPVRDSASARKGTLAHMLAAHILRGELPVGEARAVAEVSLWTPPPFPGLPASPTSAAIMRLVSKEHERRGWFSWEETEADARDAAAGAATLFDHLQRVDAIPARRDGRPLIEAKIEAPIGAALAYLRARRFGLAPAHEAILQAHCANAKTRMDAIMRPASRDREIVTDWKFSDVEPEQDDTGVDFPDPQLSWSAFVLAVTGVAVEHAARVTIQAKAPEPLLTADLIPRNNDGLPKRIHAPTTAIAFMEAMCASVYDGGKHGRVPLGSSPLATLRTLGKKGIEHAENYERHLAELAERDDRRGLTLPVATREHFLFSESVNTLARDRLTMFALRLLSQDASRNLRVYPRSPCVGGSKVTCRVRGVCSETLRGSSLDAALDAAVQMQNIRQVFNDDGTVAEG